MTQRIPPGVDCSPPLRPQGNEHDDTAPPLGALLTGLALTLAACGGGEAPPVIPAGDIRHDYRVDATLAGGVVTVTVPRTGGGTRTLDSREHREASWALASPPPALAGFVSREYLLVENRSDGKTLVFANLEQNDSDATDWLVSGWWMHFPRGAAATAIAEASERGLFFAGPELDPWPVELPEDGTATYLGGVGGIYTYRHGPASLHVEQRGATEVAEVGALMALEVDFAAGTLAGCIGCGRPITPQTYYLYPALPFRADPPVASPAGYQIALADGVLTPDGVFQSDTLIVTHATDADRIMESSGRWGGQFSNVPDATGLPRRVGAGIAHADFAEAGGTGRLEFGFAGLMPVPDG